MSAIVDKARDFWERITPSERRTVVIAAIAVPLTIAIWLAMSIHDGLEMREERNDRTRKALRVVEDLQARGAPVTPADDIVNQLKPEPISLETYLDKAAQKAQTTLKGDVTPKAPRAQNGFVTTSVSCQLEDVTIEQLKSFLQEVETDSKVVMVTHLEIRRDFKSKEKLAATLEVSTYSKEPTAKDKAEGAGSAGSGGGSAAAGSAKKGS